MTAPHLPPDPRIDPYPTTQAASFSESGADSDKTSAPLIAALASYLAETRDPALVRAAIARWCGDVAQMNLEPQVVLVQFKRLLDRLDSADQAADRDQRIGDRREMISMCIQEFYRTSR